jgi:hypothetical protein
VIKTQLNNQQNTSKAQKRNMGRKRKQETTTTVKTNKNRGFGRK